MFPKIEPEMYCDLVLKGCQSVLRTLDLVPLVLVFLFGSAKIGRSAIGAKTWLQAEADVLVLGTKTEPVVNAGLQPH